MSLTPDQIDALPTFSSAQQLKLWQQASIQVAATGTSYSISGRTLTRQNAQEIQSMINFWETRVQLEADDTGGMIALVRFGEPNGHNSGSGGRWNR